MSYYAKGCRNLASAVILLAMEDYDTELYRQDVQAFLFSDTFRLFCDFAGQSPVRIRRMLLHKDCSRCLNRGNDVLCRACWSDEPGDKNYNFTTRWKP